MAAAVLVPVVGTVVFLTNRAGDEPAGDRTGDRARIEATPDEQRADLPVLPLELAGEQSRRVQSDSPFGYAWGDPPISLVCGVDRPEGFGPDAALYQINGVFWFVDDSAEDTTVWTAVDRPVYVELRVPASIDSAPATVLSTAIAEALPYQDPVPGA